MLYTNLKHIANKPEFENAILGNVLFICGRMDTACILAFRIAEELKTTFKDVEFFDMEFDNPEIQNILKSIEITDMSTLPICICYKKGKLQNVTSEVRNKEKMKALLNDEFLSINSI